MSTRRDQRSGTHATATPQHVTAIDARINSIESRRLLSAKASAVYCDMSLKIFNVLVRPHLVAIRNPNKTHRRQKVWFDKRAIDRVIDQLSGFDPALEQNPDITDREFVFRQLEKRLL